MTMRYLFGLTGTAVTNGAIGSNPLRNDPAQIALYFNDIRPYLDVDGNGLVEAANDGVLILRELFGLSGSPLIQGAIGSGASRTTAAQVKDYVTTLKQ